MTFGASFRRCPRDDRYCFIGDTRQHKMRLIVGLGAIAGATAGCNGDGSSRRHES